MTNKHTVRRWIIGMVVVGILLMLCLVTNIEDKKETDMTTVGEELGQLENMQQVEDVQLGGQTQKEEIEDIILACIDAFALSINEEDISYVLPFLSEGSKVQEEIQALIDTSNSLRYTRIIDYTTINEIIQNGQESPIIVRTTEKTEEWADDIGVISEYEYEYGLSYDEDRYFIEYRNITQNNLFEEVDVAERLGKRIERRNLTDLVGKKIVGAVDGIVDPVREVIFDFNNIRLKEGEIVIIDGYYKDSPDKVYRLELEKQHPTDYYSLVFDEFYGENRIGKYELNFNTNGIEGFYENEETKARRYVLFEL